VIELEIETERVFEHPSSNTQSATHADVRKPILRTSYQSLRMCIADTRRNGGDADLDRGQARWVDLIMRHYHTNICC